MEKLLLGAGGRSQINYNVPSSWLNKKLSEFHGTASPVVLLFPSFAHVLAQVLKFVEKYARRACRENISPSIFLNLSAISNAVEVYIPVHVYVHVCTTCCTGVFVYCGSDVTSF